MLLVGVLIGCGGSDTATTAAPPDAHVRTKVGETLGLELESEHGTRSADLPRTDLHVHSQGHRVSTGLEITAMHKHLSGERPRLWWMHVYAIGDPRQTVRGLRSAIVETGTPDPPRRDDAGALDLDRRAVAEQPGGDVEVEDGTLHVSVPHRGHVRDTRVGVTLPPATEVSDVAFFQPIGDRRAIVNASAMSRVLITGNDQTYLA